MWSGHSGVFLPFFSFSFVFFQCRNRTGVTEPQAGHVCVIANFFSSAALWFEAFFHIKLIGAVRKCWNAAELAHGLFFFPLARERLGWIKKPRMWLLVGAPWIGRKEKAPVGHHCNMGSSPEQDFYDYWSWLMVGSPPVKY